MACFSGFVVLEAFGGCFLWHTYKYFPDINVIKRRKASLVLISLQAVIKGVL